MPQQRHEDPATVVDVPLAEFIDQCSLELGAEAARCRDGVPPLVREYDPPSATVGRVGLAADVAERLELDDGLGCRLLGHLEKLGELTDGGLCFDEVLEDEAVRTSQLGVAGLVQGREDAFVQSRADERSEYRKIEIMQFECHRTIMAG